MFSTWCDIANTPVGNHQLYILTARTSDLAAGVTELASIVPGHYSSEEKLARLFKRLGKAKVAKFLEEKLPTTKSIRSGDLGEILATEYINDETNYRTEINRLRWKDHRNMAMRGDDAIAMYLDEGEIQFLKVESKSRISLSKIVLDQARAVLDSHNGLPSPHALAFISERLFEFDDFELSDAIDDALTKEGVDKSQVRHMMFVFSGNELTTKLKASLVSYSGHIPQIAVGLRVQTHASFVKDVYEKVIVDGIDN